MKIICIDCEAEMRAGLKPVEGEGRAMCPRCAVATTEPQSIKSEKGVILGSVQTEKRLVVIPRIPEATPAAATAPAAERVIVPAEDAESAAPARVRPPAAPGIQNRNSPPEETLKHKATERAAGLKGPRLSLIIVLVLLTAVAAVVFRPWAKAGPATEPVASEEKAATAPARVSVQQAATGSGRFTIQVGSHNSESEAAEQAGRLRAAGFESRVVSVDIPKRGRWFRVQTGSFQTREEANRHGSEVLARGAAESFLVSGL